MSRNIAMMLEFSVLVSFAFSFLRAQSTPEERFWTWFQKNEDSLFEFDRDRERTFDRLGKEMHKVNPNLTFEFGPKEDGRRQFTISADGIREAFPEVEALYAAAPNLPRWEFVKFRQRQQPSDISYGGITVKASSVALLVEPSGERVDVTMFMPGYTDATKQTYTAIGYLLLDQALGEYDVEMRIGGIRIDAFSKAPERTCALQDLPKIIDNLKK